MYREPSHVPKAWRSLDACALTLEQINIMIPAAVKREKDKGENWPTALGKVRDEFRANHVQVDGQWRAK